MSGRLDLSDLLRLQQLATPTVFNGWEQITDRDMARECFNREPAHDFMPDLGPMVGYAVTLVIEPGNPAHTESAGAWEDWRAHVASMAGPKIVVVQDLDRPDVLGAFWGEVNTSIHRALGCVGTIVDGGIRDIDEMRQLGFKALARRLCVGHAHVCPVRWGEPVEVFGCAVEPGQLVHADQHGFLVVPREDEAALLDATVTMDDIERSTLIASARADHPDHGALLRSLLEAEATFDERVRDRFGRGGEFGAAGHHETT